MKKRTNEQIAMRVSWVSVAGNLLLTVFKLFAGIFAASFAMVSDAVHSASDIFSTGIVMAGVKLSAREGDKRHPYGHERFECVAALLLAILLGATGVGIGWAGAAKIAAGDYGELAVPGVLALVAAVVSIAAKEAMFWYTKRAADRIHSGALKADAWHHRSDALSSVGSLVGILGARLGVPVLDPIASLVICLFIGKAAVSVFVDAIRKMTDESCGEKVETRMREIVLRQGAERIESLKTRRFGDRIYADVEIVLDNGLAFAEAHAVSERIHAALEEAFPALKHCTVHFSPTSGKDEEGRA